MNSGDINVDNINGIPVMKFKDLNAFLPYYKQIKFRDFKFYY